MADESNQMRDALLEIVEDLADDRLTTLLDFAEYLLHKQAEEDATDVEDSKAALRESGSVAWEDIKVELDAHVSR